LIRVNDSKRALSADPLTVDYFTVNFIFFIRRSIFINCKLIIGGQNIITKHGVSSDDPNIPLTVSMFLMALSMALYIVMQVIVSILEKQQQESQHGNDESSSNSSYSGDDRTD
jgi:hypothetical protein